jgi:hypothetical protein
LASLVMYLEFASYFPNRSGSEVVYLEQAFPRPKYFFPLTFAVQTVALSFSCGGLMVTRPPHGNKKVSLLLAIRSPISSWYFTPAGVCGSPTSSAA